MGRGAKRQECLGSSGWHTHAEEALAGGWLGSRSTFVTLGLQGCCGTPCSLDVLGSVLLLGSPYVSFVLFLLLRAQTVALLQLVL